MTLIELTFLMCAVIGAVAALATIYDVIKKHFATPPQTPKTGPGGPGESADE